MLGCRPSCEGLTCIFYGDASNPNGGRNQQNLLRPKMDARCGVDSRSLGDGPYLFEDSAGHVVGISFNTLSKRQITGLLSYRHIYRYHRTIVYNSLGKAERRHRYFQDIFQIILFITLPIFSFPHSYLYASKYLLELSVSNFSRTASVDNGATSNVRGLSIMGRLFRRGTCHLVTFFMESWWMITRGTHFLLSFKG